MERIQNFKSFSTLKTQLREEAENQQKELKRGESATAFTELLRKYNVSSVSEITEDQLEKFASELFNVSEEEEEQVEEGRAFIFAASKAKKEGKTEFEWNGKKYPVTLKEAEEGKEVSAEEVNEGKRERNMVVTAWKKSGLTDLKAIAKLYADAMEDANFHQEMVTAKAIGAASQAKKSDLSGIAASVISGAAGWDGYAIANGTVDFLREIGAEEAANKLYGAISKFDLNESVNLNSLEEIIEEGTRGQFGKIYKSGEIASVYTHYDSYPEHMLPTIKKGYKKGTDVDAVLGKGDNSGLEADPSKMKFYGDPNSLKPMMGSIKNLKKYINDADSQGAEYIYLFDERDQKWYMVDVYGDRELKPAFESVTNEALVDFWPEVEMELSALFSKLYELEEDTTDSNWRKAIQGIIKSLNAVETQISKATSKLGVVPTHESAEVNENMELKKLEDAIKMFQDKIKSQGRVTNARDEDHLENLIRIYKEMGGKNIKESAEVEEGNAFGDAVRKAKEAGEEEFEFDGKTYKVEESAKDEQKAMELYVQLVDLKKGKHSEAELKGMSDDELFNLVQTEGGLRGGEAKAVAKELAVIAKG